MLYIDSIIGRLNYRIACNFVGQNIHGFRGWRSDHESDLAYLYLQLPGAEPQIFGTLFLAAGCDLTIKK